VDLVARDSPADRRAARHGALVSLGVFAVGAVGSLARVYFLNQSATKIARRLREGLLRREGRRVDRAAAVAGLSRDSEDLAKSICKNAASLYRGCNSAFGGTAMLFAISPQLTLVSLSTLPLIGSGTMAYSKFSRRLAKQFNAETDAAIAQAGDRVENIRTVRLFSKEEHEIERFEAALDSLQASGRRAGLAEGGFMGGLSFSLNTSLLAVVVYGGSLVRAGAITAGQLTSFAMYSGLVGLGFSQLSSSYADFQRSLGASQRVKSLLTAAAESADGAPDRDAVLQVPQLSDGVTVRMDGVSFAYGSDALVLRALSLELAPGRLVALTGRSGQGKSTAVSILCGELRPSAGQVLVNGERLDKISRVAYRNVLSVVDHPPALFSGLSIAENIRYADLQASDAAIRIAAERAGANEFVEALPEGYHTVLGSDDQRQLSTGQVQRVALARCFLRWDSASVFILDECTSSLDGHSEHVVLDALRRLAAAGKTVLVIAHRESTLRAADEILVLEEGQIVEQGSFEGLMALDGRFPRIIAAPP